MSRLTINMDALRNNLEVMGGWMNEFGASWTLVTKMLCGHEETLLALRSLGIHSVADSRVENLTAVRAALPDCETWYLRPPHLSQARAIASLADTSLASEVAGIEALDAAARDLGVSHKVIIMIELGDLREGILPGTLLQFYRHVFRLPNIQVAGVGANLGCLAGAVPSVEQFMQLAMYRELIELKFKVKIPHISAGSTAVLPLVLDGTLPRSINHFRIGEAVFLGTDLIHGGTLAGLRDDVFLLQAEVTELKEKSLVPLVETGDVAPFVDATEETHEPGQRGYRALVNLGQLDTDVGGLHPLNPAHHIAGASSDLTVVNIGDDPGDLRVGGSIAFRPGYGALARLMESRYVEKSLRHPSVVARPNIRETA